LKWVLVLLFKITGRRLAVGFFKGLFESYCTILFEMPPELEILKQLPVKSPELVSVFIEASRNLKSIFLNN
jgi:hypothetical protein